MMLHCHICSQILLDFTIFILTIGYIFLKTSIHVHDIRKEHGSRFNNHLIFLSWHKYYIVHNRKIHCKQKKDVKANKPMHYDKNVETKYLCTSPWIHLVMYPSIGHEFLTTGIVLILSYAHEQDDMHTHHSCCDCCIL